jgi:hypothetical protein
MSSFFSAFGSWVSSSLDFNKVSNQSGCTAPGSAEPWSTGLRPGGGASAETAHAAHCRADRR